MQTAEISLQAQPGREVSATLDVDMGNQTWASAGALVFSLENLSETETVYILELPAAGLRARARMRPKENVRMYLELPGERDAFKGLKRGPKREGHRRLATSVHPHKHLPDKESEIRLFAPKSPGSVHLRLRDARLVKPRSPFHMVDEFGQYAGADWPGKVNNLEELRHSPPAASPGGTEDLDKYGGWKAGANFTATGFFRADKSDGRHWLATPAGHPFFSLGVNAVGRGYPSALANRRHWFQWVPEGAGEKVNFHEVNLERKFGPDYREGWAARTLGRLKSWGFNTVANWSDESLWDQKSMAYTARIIPQGSFITHRPGLASKHGVPDPFDPEFVKAVDKAAAEAAERTAGDPWCIGYFVQNELDWGLWDDEKSRYALAQTVLSSPGKSPAKTVFRRHLESKYGSPGALAHAWGVTLAEWDMLDSSALQFPEAPAAGSLEDFALLTRLFASEYFRVVRDAVKRHDPDHLYLGPRFAQRWCTPEVLEEAAKYCDVLSINDYRSRIGQEDTFWKFVAGLDKPVLLAEFHFGATDRGMFHGGLQWVEDQQGRAEGYGDFLTSAAALPFVVGCHWFEYVDQPLTGRGGDGENYGIGLISVVDRPYPELTTAMRAIHATIYDLIVKAASRPPDAQ